MGRFDREEHRKQQAAALPSALGTATQDLRATVEEKLREIVEAAEARAHEIEDSALEQALEIEQKAEQKAGRRFETSTERAQQMVAAVDAFEREVRDALRTLRAKGEALGIELGAMPPRPPATDGAVADAPTETPAEEAGSTEPVAAEADGAIGESAAPEATGADLVREGVRKQILDLFMAGRPRAEAERMLGRIEDGSRYTDLLE